STGLVAAYSFNEYTGSTVYDSSGNGNNGTISGAIWATAGKYGDDLWFTGANSLVTVNNSSSLDLTNGMTLEAWVNPYTMSSAWRDVIFKGNTGPTNNYYLEASSPYSSVPAGGALLSSGQNVEANGTSALKTGTWTL